MRRTRPSGQRHGCGENAAPFRRPIPYLFASLMLLGNACSVSSLQRDTTRVVSTTDDSITFLHARLGGSDYLELKAKEYCLASGRRPTFQSRHQDNLDRDYVTYQCVATDPQPNLTQAIGPPASDAGQPTETPPACVQGEYWDSVAKSCRSISPAAEQGSSPTPASPERKTTQRFGTAFVVRPDGVLLTAFHVVKDAKTIEVSCPESGNANARLEQFSKANDLAVLRVAGKTPTYLSLGDQQSVNLGEQVFTIGYPAPDVLGSEAKFTDGVVSSVSVAGDAGYMQISVPVHPGNSGGPLINSSGDVVGVVIATVPALSFLKETGALPQNVSWAVKGAFTAPLFDPPPRSPRITDRGAVIRRAVRATCFVTTSTEADE